MDEKRLSLPTGISSEPGGLLKALHIAQKHDGYISREDISQIAEAFGLPEARIYETASFYSYLHLQPVGRHVIRVCESAPCHVAGAAQVIETLEKLLNASMGSTTDDHRFTLQYTECVGQCQNSPTITIDGHAYPGITPNELPNVLANYQ